MKRRLWWMIGIIFVISRLTNLTHLPIFADEAIYIRWATMIFHDPHQFLFLPLYDGKSPLFIWLLIPFVKLFPYDPLFGARLLSSLFGLVTLWAIVKIVKQLGGTNRSQLFGALLVTLLPYTLFHDRMGLLDSAVTTALGWSFYFFLLWRQNRKMHLLIFAGVCWGVGLMIKTTAFYFAPAFVGLFFWDFITQPKIRTGRTVLAAAASLGIGLLCLGWMRISPLFPFLFQRSSDFAFTIKEIITQPGMILMANVPRISRWLLTYYTPGVWIILGTFIGIVRKKCTSVFELLVSFMVFLLPFLFTGKLLASRYFLPAIIFIIPATALALDELWNRKKWIGVSFLTFLIVCLLRFDIPLWFSPESTPFTHDDIHQYLADWSAGYGIPTTRDYLTKEVQSGKKVLVGTEGLFGTLPDGLFVYFSETQFLKQMEIIGVGQPVVGLSDEMKAKTSRYDETFLVVNQDRLHFDYSSTFDLVGTYAKPHNGAPLLLLKLKQ